jgi:hypothetical protein
MKARVRRSEMPTNEDEAVETKDESTATEADEENSKAGAEDDEDEVEGHVSTPDLWLPSNNKWRRRR